MCRSSVRATRTITSLLVIPLLMFLTGCNGSPDPAAESETAQDGPAEIDDTLGPESDDPFCQGTIHYLTIDQNGPKCVVTDANGNTDIKVQRGDWVVWTNNVNGDVSLVFASSKRLFGVVKADVYGQGGELRLKVREDAEIKTNNAPHVYQATGCGSTQPPPGIIVCPPGGCT